ncbi:MAG: DNA topoisomerase IB [Steroidobacteraceae bacterium]
MADKASKAEIRERAARKTAATKGLHYVSDTMPGIRRITRGKNFAYVNAKGKAVTSVSVLQRIGKLAIPPAYDRVWICSNPLGHLQATGFDARGRKQYRYHERWRSVRDADKFLRMVQFGSLLPKLRRRLQLDLQLPGLPLQKVLALVVTLLQTTLLRVGNGDYVRQNNSFGLTTLRDRHVRFIGKTRVKIQFRGKSGQAQSAELSDRRIAHILRRCQELPGQQLFQYVDEGGNHQPIHSGMVNDYLLEIMGVASDGTGFTAKDFRTWGATLHAIQLLVELPQQSRVEEMSTREINHVLVDVCSQVAQALGNTPAVCRKSYINPWVLQSWSQGSLPTPTQPCTNRRQLERYALQVLKLQRRRHTADG